MTRRAVAQKERCGQVELRCERKTARTDETKEAKGMIEISEDQMKASKAFIESEKEEGLQTGASIKSGERPPLTQKEMWSKDKIYLIGLYKGLTGQTAKRIWWRKRDLIADIWEEQLRIFPESTKEAKTMARRGKMIDEIVEEYLSGVSEETQPKRKLSREQKERNETNRLMKKYDEERQELALSIYEESEEYAKTKDFGYIPTEHEKVWNYLQEDWTFDDLWDLARRFGVKPRGYRDNSWDMGSETDYDVMNRLSRIISLIGSRLTKEEARGMTKLTVKELKAQAKVAGIKGYSRMKKAELESALREVSEEEATMKHEEYFRTEQKKVAREVKDELEAADTSTEKRRILEEAEYFMLEGIAIELGMTLPPMPEKEELRERLIALFASAEEPKPSPEETEARKESQTVLSEIRSEPDAKKREEKLRSITDSKKLEDLAKELYGADYVRELLLRDLCRTEERAESQTESPSSEVKPVTRQEFQKAFDELEKGRIYVSIPKLRKKLGWSHEEFDEMIYSLRNDETIILHATEAGRYEPEEFFYDEDNERMGMVTWKAA